MIDPEFKEKWLAKLQDGSYDKGMNQLRNADDTYCCLGVACDILDPDGWNKGREDTATYYWMHGRDITFMPTSLSKSIGLELAEQADLVELNDLNETWGLVIEYIRENL
jgi:hypothetical protein